MHHYCLNKKAINLLTHATLKLIYLNYVRKIKIIYLILND